LITLDVEYLKYEEIAKIAADFLDQNGANSIPIAIEDIIDINLGVNIIPIPGLQDIYGVDGFMSSDCLEIYIDNFVYEERPYRYRFTLAHEIAHSIIHRQYLCNYSFNNIDEWKNFYNELDNSDHSKMEFQAYAFGGLVLVPRQTLATNVKDYLPQITLLIKEAKRKDIKRKDYLSYAINELASLLSPIFEASIDVLIRRIQFDKLESLIP